MSFFTAAEIGEAKKTVIDTHHVSIGDNVFTTGRRDSATRPAHEAELDDIIGLFDLLDNRCRLCTVQFVAADFDRLPKFGPEELNFGAIVDRHQQLDAAVGKLSAEVEELKLTALAGPCQSGPDGHSAVISGLTELNKQFDIFHASVNSRIVDFQASVDSHIDHLNSICT